MRSVLLLLTTVVIPLLGIHIDFERVEQVFGTDSFVDTLRVRKYNRTTIVLNGTFTSKVILNNSYSVSTDLFHSPLGNQQFNHYPMKLPSQKMCDFINTLHDEYDKFLTNIYNLPGKDSCPVYPQDVHTIDKIFPTEAIPRYLPKGLWKTFITISLRDVEVAKFVWILKVTSDFL